MARIIQDVSKSQITRKERPLLSPNPNTTFSAKEDSLPLWKDKILKECHRLFIRHRKPSTEQLRNIIQMAIPELKDISTPAGVVVYDSAKKAFQNMRADFVKAARDIGDQVVAQINRFVVGITNSHIIPSL